MINNINNFFSVKFSLFILIIICAITILLSRNYYVYDLTGGDAPTYFSLASDLKNYFYLPHQESLRIIPIISVIGVSKIFNVGLENAFYIVTYILYFILVIQTFFFFKSFNISNYLSLSLLAILYYLHHSILYTLFNPYQVVDLYGYIYFLLFFELPRKKGVLPLFILSLLAVFTKEYFLVLVLFSFVYHYIKFKNTNSIYATIILLVLFTLHFNFASSGITNNEGKRSVEFLILSFVLDYRLYLNSILNSLIIERNIMLFFPFILIFLNKKFLNFCKNYVYMLPYSLVPIAFSILLFHNVGNNFFRVFFHGYFIFIVLSLVFMAKEIDKEKISLLIFITPFFFIIDYFYLILNVHQDGFFRYFQYQRFEMISGFYIFNIVFIICLFLINKKLPNETKKK